MSRPSKPIKLYATPHQLAVSDGQEVHLFAEVRRLGAADCDQRRMR